MKKNNHSSERRTIEGYLKIALLVIGILALGMFAVNQFTGWIFKAELVYKPCDLCLNQNEQLKLCPNVNIGTISKTTALFLQAS